MPKRRTTADKLESLLTHYSVSETARRLGVDRRTVQRWKSGQTKEPSKESRGKIGRMESGVRAGDRATARAEGFQKPAIPVDVPAHRQTVADPKQLARGVSAREADRIYSNTVIYDVSKASDPAILQLLEAYKGVSPATGFRFIYEHRKSPDKRKQKSGIEFYIPPAVQARLDRGEKNVRISTSYRAVGDRPFRTPDGLLDAIGDVRGIGKLLYVVFLDERLPTPGRGRKKPRRSR